ncbi:MAG: hypothetical protein MRZ98_01235, partial [Clostridiales bacterium]|nr:hypothetical protein [Clostridiales bacterium]
GTATAAPGFAIWAIKTGRPVCAFVLRQGRKQQKVLFGQALLKNRKVCLFCLQNFSHSFIISINIG